MMLALSVSYVEVVFPGNARNSAYRQVAGVWDQPGMPGSTPGENSSAALLKMPGVIGAVYTFHSNRAGVSVLVRL